MIKKSLYYILLLFVLYVIIYTQVVQASCDVIEHTDDLNVMFSYFTNFFDSLTYAYHGRFITNAIASLVGVFLPLLLDIHPNYWIQTFGAGIKAIFIFMICYLLSSSLFVFDKKIDKYKKICICIVVLLLYFLYQNIFNHRYQSMVYMSFYGFTFPFIIYLFFWRKFIKFFCDNNNDNKPILILCVLSFLIGCSSEFFSFTAFGCLTLIMVLLSINKYKNILIYLYIYVSECLGLIIYVCNPGFIKCVKGKVWEFPRFIQNTEGKGWTFFDFFNVFKDWIMEVKEGLYQVFFLDFIYIVITIIVLFVLLIFLKIENKRGKVLIVSFYLLSVIFFYLFMSFVRDGHLYIVHFDIIVQVQIALLFTTILQISFLSEYKYLKNLMIMVLIVCLVYHTKQNFIDTYKLIIENDKNNYVLKYYNNSLYNISDVYKCEYILLEDIKKCKVIFNNDNFYKDLSPYHNESYNYMTMIYDVDYEINQKDLYVQSVDQLYEKFLNEGGTPLSQEELDKHNFNFLLKKYKKKKNTNFFNH